MVVGRLTPGLGWVLESNSNPGHISAQFFARKPIGQKMAKKCFWLFCLPLFIFILKKKKSTDSVLSSSR
jgi:hypothetical protein